MANARQIVRRRKAVTNTRKITKTMQLIATSRFQQAFTRAMATKPYTRKITQLVEELSAAAEGQIDHPLLAENEDTTRDVTLILSANRGLCGGYNGNVLRKAMEHIKSIEAQGREREVHVVGKKGIAYCRFFGLPIEKEYTDIDEKLRFDQVEPIATEFMSRYERGEIANVYVVYMKFISTGRQQPEVLRLLPLKKDEPTEDAPQEAADQGTGSVGTAQYDFSPEPKELLKALLPQTVKIRLFQAFTDMVVSEQVARMIAMKAATDAAGDMIKSLSREYNRARQTQITLELLDIVGGVEALN